MAHPTSRSGAQHASESHSTGPSGRNEDVPNTSGSGTDADAPDGVGGERKHQSPPDHGKDAAAKH